ncbi:hypothetical protein ACFL21_01415 [Patescibacteria group bacterium]
MDITLSWDLFVIVLFVVIVAYSFIIGRDNTLKVILGTYISALAADAIGNLFGLYFAGSALFMKILSMASVSSEGEAIIFVKVLVFVGLVILFAVKGAYRIKTHKDSSSIVRLVVTIFYSCMSAVLIITALLTFVSGVSFIGGGNAQTTSVALWWINNQSQVIRTIINYSYFWFAIPALSFLFHSLYSRKKAAAA